MALLPRVGHHHRDQDVIGGLQPQLLREDQRVVRDLHVRVVVDSPEHLEPLCVLPLFLHSLLIHQVLDHLLCLSRTRRGHRGASACRCANAVCPRTAGPRLAKGDAAVAPNLLRSDAPRTTINVPGLVCLLGVRLRIHGSGPCRERQRNARPPSGTRGASSDRRTARWVAQLRDSGRPSAEGASASHGFTSAPQRSTAPRNRSDRQAPGA